MSKQNKSYGFIFFSRSHLQQFTSFGQSLPLHLSYCKRTSSQTATQYQRLPPTSQYGPQKKCLSWSNDCSFDHKRLFLKCWVNLKVSRGFFLCYQQNLFADIKGVFWKSIKCIWFPSLCSNKEMLSKTFTRDAIVVKKFESICSQSKECFRKKVDTQFVQMTNFRYLSFFSCRKPTVFKK